MWALFYDRLTRRYGKLIKVDRFDTLTMIFLIIRSLFSVGCLVHLRLCYIIYGVKAVSLVQYDEHVTWCKPSSFTAKWERHHRLIKTDMFLLFLFYHQQFTTTIINLVIDSTLQRRWSVCQFWDENGSMSTKRLQVEV